VAKKTTGRGKTDAVTAKGSSYGLLSESAKKKNTGVSIK